MTDEQRDRLRVVCSEIKDKVDVLGSSGLLGPDEYINTTVVISQENSVALAVVAVHDRVREKLVWSMLLPMHGFADMAPKEDGRLPKDPHLMMRRQMIRNRIREEVALSHALAMKKV